MTDAWAIVIAALVTGFTGIGASVLSSFKKMRQENRDDHGLVMQKLDSVKDGIESVSERLDSHIDWHLRK
jgi:hypothetical protein